MPAAPAKVILTGLIVGTVQFGIAILSLGGWSTFFSHRPLVALTLITIVLMLAAPFASGNMSSGIKEDRGNRWVLAAFSLVALLSAFVPPYTDRLSLWTIDGETTRWGGVTLYAIGGFFRLWPVYVLGHRFSGLVAIQPGHQLETHGIYSLIRNPSYLGLLLNLLGWGLAFRAWAGVFIAFLVLVPLIPRIRAEERLLRSHFGAQYDTYCKHTWRLVPGVY